VNTEFSDISAFNGWILFDGQCPFCARAAARFHRLLAARRFELLPLQTPWIRSRLGMPDSQLLAEMRLMRPDGTLFGGADAVVEIARHFPWTWPLRQISRVPGAMALLRILYRWCARNRTCAHGACPTKSPLENNPSRLADYLPLFGLPMAALLLRTELPDWIFMWVMAFSLYGGCKWLTYRRATRRGASPSPARLAGYFLAWPGMDASAFFDKQKIPAPPRAIEWLTAAANVVFGCVLIWGVTPVAFATHPLLAGWIGMVGMILVLHFGSFHISALAWRHMGVTATPLMQKPHLSKSLAEFWGRRWNTAFNELAFRFAFRPLRRFTSPATATLLVYGLSGLIH
jgi:predicted DCC family thiol-disulfide oxidoreductase YuxK